MLWFVSYRHFNFFSFSHSRTVKLTHTDMLRKSISVLLSSIVCQIKHMPLYVYTHTSIMLLEDMGARIWYWIC